MKWNEVNLAKQKAINSETQAAEKRSKANAQAKEAAKAAAASGTGGAVGRRDPRGVGTDSRKRKRDEVSAYMRRVEWPLDDHTYGGLLSSRSIGRWSQETRAQTCHP